MDDPNAGPAPLAASLALDATLSLDYGFLVVASCLLATLGLLADSTAVVIGAMIVAPLLLPIRALAWGALQRDLVVFRRALAALAAAVAVAIALSALVGAAVGLQVLGKEVLARTAPNLLDLGVAVVAGAVGAFAKLRPRIGDAVAGTAIAVALMPPLCASGLCLAYGDHRAALGALTLFVTNLVGIALACMAVFAYHGEQGDGKRVRDALTITAVITAGLAFPLGYSFLTLLQQARLGAAVQHLLTSRTVTVGQRMELVATHVDWSLPEPEVRLVVRARELPSGRQVALLEDFVRGETHRRFHLVFEVSLLREVRSEGPAAPASPGR